jgi:tRNA-dihydrouridine synthase B
MKIGKLDLGKGAILGPMAEITDAPFRNICKEEGASLTFTQMVSAEGIVKNSFNSLRFLAFSRNEKPVGVQLLGNKEEYLKRAAEELVQLHPDIIDLNCGCSAQKVCRVGMGAGLMVDRHKLTSLVRAMTEASGDIPVSVKLRLGKSRQQVSVLDNAKAAEDGGASMITVHARSQADSYADEPMYEWLAKVKQSVSIPVVGNGSVFDPETALKVINETGVDSLLIARGALGNPFLFRRVKTILETGVDPGNPDISYIAATAKRHLHLIIRDRGEYDGIRTARKHLIWYFMYFPGVYEFVGKIYSADKAQEVENSIDEHTGKISENFYPEEDRTKIKKSFNERVLFWMSDNESQTLNN